MTSSRLLGLPNRDVVTVDTETSGLHWDDGAKVSTVIVGWKGSVSRETTIRVLPFDQGRMDEKLPFKARELDLWGRGEEDANLGKREWDELMEWLATRAMLVMHHAKFDLHMLRVGTREWSGVDLVEDGRGFVWCTQVCAKELDPLEPVGLDKVAERLFGEGEGKVDKDKLKDWLRARKLDTGRYDLVPIEIMERYAEGDVAATIKVYDYQIQEVVKREMLDQVARKMDVMQVLYKMERRGVPYDAAKSMQIADRIDEEIRRLEKSRPFAEGLNAARKWFFHEQGGDYLRVTEKGAISLDEQTTRSLVKQGVEWAEEYAKLAVLKTSNSMWYNGYVDKIGLDGRLRCSYRQTKVVSNRMSVERVQLQAIPKQNKLVEELLGPGTSVRSLIRSDREGTLLWNLDLQQAELRVAAKYARCEKMLAMLEEGIDFHSETTKRVMGVDESDSEWKLKRDIGKRLTFSSIFQIGPEALKENLAKVANIDVELDEAQQMVWRWRAEYPEFSIAYRKAEKLAEKRKWVWLLAKTRYASKSYYAEWEPKNTAWSRMVQGSLAEALQLWLVEAERRVPDIMILTVHDSIVLETDDEGKVEQVVGIGEKLLSRLFKIQMPVEARPWDA